MYAALNGMRSRVFSVLTFHTRPHHATFFRAVRGGTRDVDKCHPRIQPGQRFTRGHRERVGQLFVLLLGHSRGRDSQAEEARIDSGQLRLNRRIMKQVGLNDIVELGDCSRWARTGQRSHGFNLLDRAGIPAKRLAPPCPSLQIKPLSSQPPPFGHSRTGFSLSVFELPIASRAQKQTGNQKKTG